MEEEDGAMGEEEGDGFGRVAEAEVEAAADGKGGKRA